MKTKWNDGPLLLIVAMFLFSLVFLATSPGAGFTYPTTPGTKATAAAGNQPTGKMGSYGTVIMARENASDDSKTVPGNGVSSVGGNGTFPMLSDGNTKINLGAVDALEILDKVAALPMTTWKYKGQERPVRHMGPVGEDFKSAFGLGDSAAGVAVVDESGVALAAIQGLNEKVEMQAAELKARDARIRSLERRLFELEKMVTAKAQH